MNNKTINYFIIFLIIAIVSTIIILFLRPKGDKNNDNNTAKIKIIELREQFTDCDNEGYYYNELFINNNKIDLNLTTNANSCTWKTIKKYYEIDNSILLEIDNITDEDNKVFYIINENGNIIKTINKVVNTEIITSYYVENNSLFFTEYNKNIDVCKSKETDTAGGVYKVDFLNNTISTPFKVNDRTVNDMINDLNIYYDNLCRNVRIVEKDTATEKAGVYVNNQYVEVAQRFTPVQIYWENDYVVIKGSHGIQPKYDSKSGNYIGIAEVGYAFLDYNGKVLKFVGDIPNGRVHCAQNDGNGYSFLVMTSNGTGSQSYTPNSNEIAAWIYQMKYLGNGQFGELSRSTSLNPATLMSFMSGWCGM